MIFKRVKEEAAAPPLRGSACAMCGQEAVRAVEALVGSHVFALDAAEWAEGGVEGRISCGRDFRALAAAAAGSALGGLRSAVLTSDIAGDVLAGLASVNVPVVIHLIAKAGAGMAQSMHGGHSAYFDAANAGLIQWFGKNAQEAADFAVIARALAEWALVPVLCAQDFYDTSHSVRRLFLPDEKLVAEFLGEPGDEIDSPTAAQEVLFGKWRRRVPRLLDPSQAGGIGGFSGESSYGKGELGRRIYFQDEAAGLLGEVTARYARLTGRRYEPVEAYRVSDADMIVMAQGAVVERLEEVVDFLRERGGVKAGVINLRVFRPFPGAALTELLRGRKDVTVLERCGASYADEGPLAREVRAALDKATENGLARGETPFPGYASFRKASERPRIYWGVYGVGAQPPSFDELCAVYENMAAQGARKRRFWMGLSPAPDLRRYPHLQTLRQRLAKDYPQLDALTVDVRRRSESFVAGGVRAFTLIGLPSQGALFAGNLFARALASGLKWNVRTFPDGGLLRHPLPARFTLAHTLGEGPLRLAPEQSDTLLLSTPRLLDGLAGEGRLRNGGALVVGVDQSVEEFWRGLSRRTVEWIRRSKLAVYLTHLPSVLSESRFDVAYLDQLAIWALLGAYAKTGEGAGALGDESFLGALRGQLEETLRRRTLVDGVVEVFRAGVEQTQRAPHELIMAEREEKAEVERPAPWTVEAKAEGPPLFSPTRFWRSVGYLYETGQADVALCDPFAATSLVPGRTSAFHDMTPYRLGAPRWLPERCDGCGLCWAACPDSALPPAAPSLAELLETALERSFQGGAAPIQLPRIKEALVRRAHQEVERDDLRQYTNAAAIFEAAFSYLLPKMNLAEGKTSQLTSEFEKVRVALAPVEVTKAPAFFSVPEKESKGSGRLLSIAWNPSSCTGCQVCVETCPQGAFEWSPREAEGYEARQAHWDLLRDLGPVGGEVARALGRSAPPDSAVYHLLDWEIYHGLAGGSGSFPGNGPKAAVHLICAAIDSVMRPRFQAHGRRLTGLIDALKASVQDEVRDAVSINDFEEFRRRLDELKPGAFSAAELVKPAGGRVKALDPERLRRRCELIERLEAQRRRYTGVADKRGRAGLIMVIDSARESLWSGAYPYNPHAHPWISAAPGMGAEVGRGLRAAVRDVLLEEAGVCRLAEAELEGRLDGRAGRLGWSDLTPEERALAPVVVIVSEGEGGRVAVRPDGAPIIHVALVDKALDLGERGGVDVAVAPNGGAFMLQTSIGAPGHLLEGVAGCVELGRGGYVRVFAPEPHANGIAPRAVFGHARMAFESRAFPLFRIDGESGALSLGGNPDPEQDWTTHELKQRKPSGEEAAVQCPLTVADWAVREGRYHQEFTLAPRGRLTGDVKPVDEFLDMPVGEREGYSAFVHATGADGAPLVAFLSPAMVAEVEAKRGAWRFLQARASGKEESRVEPVSSVVAPTRQGVTDAVLESAMIERLTARLLELCGYGRDPEFFSQTLRAFVAPGKSGGGE